MEHHNCRNLKVSKQNIADFGQNAEITPKLANSSIHQPPPKSKNGQKTTTQRRNFAGITQTANMSKTATFSIPDKIKKEINQATPLPEDQQDETNHKIPMSELDAINQRMKETLGNSCVINKN